MPRLDGMRQGSLFKTFATTPLAGIETFVSFFLSFASLSTLKTVNTESLNCILRSV